MWGFHPTPESIRPKKLVGRSAPIPGILSFVEKKVSKETFPSTISGRLVPPASGKLIQTRPFGTQTRINFSPFGLPLSPEIFEWGRAKMRKMVFFERTFKDFRKTEAIKRKGI